MVFKTNLTATFERLNNLLSTNQNRTILAVDVHVKKLTKFKEIIEELEVAENTTTNTFIKNHYLTICDILAKYFISQLDFNRQYAYKHFWKTGTFEASYHEPVTLDEFKNTNIKELDEFLNVIFGLLLSFEVDFSITIEKPNIEDL